MKRRAVAGVARIRAVLTVAVVRRRLERELSSSLRALRGAGRARATDALASARVQRLRAALERLQHRQYGKCAACGKPIGDTRLRLLPGVGTCAQCQKSIDRLAR